MEKIKFCECCEKNKDALLEAQARIDNEPTIYDLSELFKIFGDTTRIRILFIMFESEVCVCDLSELLNMNQSAVSHQLKILKQAKLVKSRRVGKQMFYSLDDDHVRNIIEAGLEHLTEE